MPVFKDLAKDTGADVKWIYNTSTQYANNADPVGIKGIDAIYHSGFSNLKLYNYLKIQLYSFFYFIVYSFNLYKRFVSVSLYKKLQFTVS